MKSSSKNTLVFLPGWGFKSSVWENTINSFQDHPILLLDLPSITEKNLSIANQLNIITYQLHTQIPHQSTIIAWSLGGLIAMHLCHQYPHQYKQLILTNSSPKFSSASQWPGISTIIEKLFMHDIQHHFNDLINKFIKIIQYPLTNKLHQDFLLQHFLPSRSSSLINYLQLLFSVDLRHTYSQLTLPITHIVGQKDAIIPIEVIKPLKKLNSLVNIHIIPKAGHSPFLTHSSTFIKYIQDII